MRAVRVNGRRPGEDRARRRRALVLGGLALVLGGLAAADMAGRERALRAQVGEPVPVLVARTAIEAGAPMRPADLAIRRVPARYAPRGALRSPAEAAGLRAAVAIAPESEVLAGMVDDGRGAGQVGAPVRRGERIAEVVAAGSAEFVQPGARVDVLVTREDRAGGGGTVLALQDVEVLGAQAAPPAGDAGAGAAERVAASLRVSLRQAVYLAAAQSFAREVRLLPRAPADRRRATTAVETGADLAPR